MKQAYPVIISKSDDKWYGVHVPDFDIDTQGKDIPDAIYMARDAIGIVGITREDMGQELPLPYSAPIIKEHEDDIITLVDIDFTEYRKKADNRAVKKNCSIPYSLNEQAEKAGINFSKVLQEALSEKLQKSSV